MFSRLRKNQLLLKYLRIMVDREEFSGTFRERESCSAPWGMLSFDKKALSALQQQYLNSLKTKELRRSSVQYLMTHPQVDAVLSVLLRAIFLHRPSDPIKFAAEMVKRADFRSELDRYLAQRGSRSRRDRRIRGDTAELINPEAFSRRKTDASETQRELSTSADSECSPWSELPETLLSAVSSPSVESADSLEECKDESQEVKESALRDEENGEVTRKLIAEFFEAREDGDNPGGE
ncbi:hypothetical protein J437_LFUL001316 [Ladona fulva]|uniref:Uncharacterized protein n=1 Tax=Ladona fulva TaxID=123851 RepID=A0A8K0JZ46_LADFU|nr:hypothetical protein J437_LFUL001316 [Ladona fulva]